MIVIDIMATGIRRNSIKANNTKTTEIIKIPKKAIGFWYYIQVCLSKSKPYTNIMWLTEQYFYEYHNYSTL